MHLPYHLQLNQFLQQYSYRTVSYTHLRAHETKANLVCRLLLEKNVSWISLFIALAPMLGFMGTVIGMITAFDRIEAAGDMQPSLVAGGIKVALLTTVFGLIVAIILQVFYNYIVAKIDSIVNDMEDASITLIDILSAQKK